MLFIPCREWGVLPPEQLINLVYTVCSVYYVAPVMFAAQNVGVAIDY